MVVPLDSVQVDYDPPTEYPDNEQDKPIDGLALVPGFSSVLAVLTHFWGRALSLWKNETTG